MVPIPYKIGALLVALILISGVSFVLGYRAAGNKAPEIREVVTKGETKTRTVIQEKIVEVRPDTTTVTTERKVDSNTQEETQVVDVTRERDHTYSIGVEYEVPVDKAPDWKTPAVEFGRRLIGPIWGTLTWRQADHSVSAGVRIEL